jgi:hypothetical protein
MLTIIRVIGNDLAADNNLEGQDAGIRFKGPRAALSTSITRI